MVGEAGGRRVCTRFNPADLRIVCLGNRNVIAACQRIPPGPVCFFRDRVVLAADQTGNRLGGLVAGSEVLGGDRYLEAAASVGDREQERLGVDAVVPGA